MSMTSTEAPAPIAVGIGVLVIATVESPHAEIAKAQAASATSATQARGRDFILERPPQSWKRPAELAYSGRRPIRLPAAMTHPQAERATGVSPFRTAWFEVARM